MTTTLPPKTLSRNLRVAEAINHLIVVLTGAHAAYWNRPDAELLAEMNADVAATIETFEGNYQLATSLNAAQDALNVVDESGNAVYSARVPTERGRSDIAFQDGAFFIIPPPVTEEPAPEAPAPEQP